MGSESMFDTTADFLAALPIPTLFCAHSHNKHATEMDDVILYNNDVSCSRSSFIV